MMVGGWPGVLASSIHTHADVRTYIHRARSGGVMYVCVRERKRREGGEEGPAPASRRHSSARLTS